jgi:hypothetical protein
MTWDESIAQLVSYGVAAFAVGWSAGWIQKAFHQLTEKL